MRKALRVEVEVLPAVQEWIDFEEVKEEGKTFWTRLLYTFFCLFLLYNIVLVLPYIDMNPPRVYTCSPS